MPIYVYQAINESCQHCAEEFEVFQTMSAEQLRQCKHCGNPIHRVIQPVGMRMGKKYMLSDKNLQKHGFSKLVNEGDGKFRKI